MKHYKSSKKIIKDYFELLELENKLNKKRMIFTEARIDLMQFKKSCISELTDLEKQIIINYHFEDKSLKAISTELNYSYSYVRRIYVQAKEKMRIIMSMQ